MKVGRFLGRLGILGLVQAGSFTTFAAAADNDPATTATNHQSKIGGIFQQLLNHAITNLAESHTNLTATSTNTISTNGPSAAEASAHLASIPPLELSAGVKEAIGNGLSRAVAFLGRTNGFLTNSAVKIQLPSQLANVDKMVRAVGQGPLVDQFVATMNHAAEQAVPVATGIFADSLTQMTIADARALLLSNSKTAATEYFRRTTTNQLSEKFLPIVRDATQKTGVTAAYKNLLGKARFATVLGGGSLDVDQYVTGKALDGLFTMVAEEEVRIRENPQARVTGLLQKVFGALPQAAIGAPPLTQTSDETRK
jgi:hypothetical protein